MSLWRALGRAGEVDRLQTMLEPSRDEEAVQRDQPSFLTQAIGALFALFCKKLMMVL